MQGAWDAALGEARRAAERFAEGVLNARVCGKAHYRQGEVHRLRGERSAAEESYREASRRGYEPQPGLALLRLAEGKSHALRPGGTVVLEEWDVSSWHFNPSARALESLVELIGQSFMRSGGDIQAGRKLLDLLRGFGIEGNVRAEVLALPPGHPYLRLPLQFATALEERLLSIVTVDELKQLRKEAKPSSRSRAAGAPPSRSCSAGASARRSSPTSSCASAERRYAPPPIRSTERR
jgi:hypothetical protein